MTTTVLFDDARHSRTMIPSRAIFFGSMAALFAASAALTIALCTSMSSMRDMPMPGGWAMSMMWMRMPGQTWLSAAASFLGMWIVMMTAMMLPSLAPVLWRGRPAAGGARAVRWVALVGAGYFFAWALVGMAVFASGMALAALAMRQPALARFVPMASGIVVVIAGVLQLTAWKLRQLACCRAHDPTPAQAGAALRYGIRLGLRCVACCAGLTAMLLVLGVMDLGAMTLVAAAITAERLAPAGERVARAIGAVIVVAGLFLIARAAGVA